jgi:hypothetical protein
MSEYFRDSAEVENMSRIATPSRHVGRHAGGLVAFGMLLASTTISHAQCVELTDRTPTETMQLFTSEPSALLYVLRNDKDKLAARLTGILVTDPKVLPSVATLVRKASTDIRPTIGKALRQAELRCVASQPQAARKINDFVRNLADRSVTAGYVAVTEEPSNEPTVGDNNDTSVIKPARPPTKSNPLLTGEWHDELADPFESVPLPE